MLCKVGGFREVKKFHKLIVPLLLATAGLVAIFMLPIRAGTSEVMIEAARAAENNPSGLSEMSLGAQTVVLSGTDIALSGTGGRLPEVAANGTFVAVVYEQNGSVYIRSVKASVGEWQPARLIASQAYVPKLAFRQGSTNTVHVVWVGDSTGKYIRHMPCTLADSGPTCPSDHISAIATADSNLVQPDVAVDSDGGVHVAWLDINAGLSGTIKTAYSTNALDSSPTWTTKDTVPVQGGSNAGQPTLAAAGNYVHLTLKDKNGSDWEIEYYRLLKDHTSGGASEVWGTFWGDVNGYEEMNNPTIAAVGANVYLAWDNQQDSTDTYGLVGVESTNSGGSWGLAKHITSTNLATETAVTADEKLSERTGAPTIEESLRPSLAITDSNKFAIVWQQQPGICKLQEYPGGPTQNGTSEIFFASPHDSWATSGMLADNQSEYSIDPDIAVDANGTHIVFMKADDDDLCQGGNQGEYRIYYRGPFTAVSQGGGVYLPIILKNSS